ncbi:cyclic-AMP receptor protein [Grosmannia clavigera kw1407]|uniref:Cyclic-AMP receptor protein n=1 Tax=Grosmannia clavigera (strain kw1407 / UAMH 11150) TaxID=655863 RepID=F0XJI9_GROCL|nr:cyclic-AMP receptor protein [Grosmannia clavigera kw1407]EFX02224.1 cyclic-AMP receptor protein [Grosmannia clavigera kw1407]
MTLSAEQLHVLEIVERCCSGLSILGILIIIITFFSSKYFRNPIDRLILINAVYNIFDVAATMISLSGPSAGDHSALCRFQGFLMQMFPLADVLWTLAMACDVFLIVFYQYDPKALRKLELKYIGGITIITFIPAFVFLFVHTAEKGHMLAIFIATLLYCLVGWKIVSGKRALRSIEVDLVPLDTRLAEKIYKNGHDSGHELLSLGPDRISRSRDGSESTYQLRPPENFTPSRNWQGSQSALSLRQYILMPGLFLVVLLAIWVAPTTNRIASFVRPDYVSFPLYIAVGATGSLRGFWNGVVFLAVGMRSRQSQKNIEEKMHPTRLVF